VNNHSYMAKNKYLAAVIPCLIAMQTQALEFSYSDIEGTFNSSLSLGSSWRMEEQDDGLLGGVNIDDSNANFAKGDAFSQVFKGSHDLQISYQNLGGFVRGKYWYDSLLKDNNVEHGHAPTASVGTGPADPLSVNHAGESRLDDSGFDNLSKFSGAQLLDAYVYGDFDVYDMPLGVRLGKQVVSWGESTFIPGGINSINAIDVNALTQPGSEIKEALLPVNMAYASLGLSENLSLEAFYLLEFQETVLPGCGTYFAALDYISRGCDLVTIKNSGLKRIDDGYQTADSDGQFGLSFRFAPAGFTDSEFGFYFMNIHSRMPIGSGVKSTMTDADKVLAGQAGAGLYFASIGVAPQNATQDQLVAAQLAGKNYATGEVIKSAGYLTVYPEDIQLFGFSFATSLDSFALSGEINHKVDVPLQVNSTQLITVSVAGNTDGLADVGLRSSILDDEVNALSPGSVIDGYRLFDVSQAQVTLIGFFDRVLGAERFTLAAETGYTYIHNFVEGDNEIKFGRSSVYDKEGDTGGFVSQASWGYRATLQGEYSDVFSGVSLSPKISWKHDVRGVAPKSGGIFNEGQQSLGFSVTADYMSTYRASVAYTQFMGGDYSIRGDRDFASVNVGMQF